ncbi:type II toxin-antitoxin system RelE/ParE family toxin [Candidatus Poriferisocius sp.]|uniref:type II toxin-antitoxin system RelE/ParE family toxin n=1 Tax=Candidatus Poriferisocius sp. TaxID=3101276 RepID=UPI003B028455
MEVLQTDVFERWFNNLRDRNARARVLARIRRLQLGNPGDFRPVGKGVSEMRIDHGPGYRVYFVRRQQSVVLLVGGNKNSQNRDIDKATKMAQRL